MASMSISTADLLDSNAALYRTGDLRVLHPIFHLYGLRRSFCGPIVTLKVFEENVQVKELLDTSGRDDEEQAGKVLVVDGGGSKRCALLGGNLAQLGRQNGWAGIVVNGCIRDVDEINECDIGVRALGSHPLKPLKKGVGDKHVPLYHFAGALIRPGEWLYADSDGILISKSKLSL